MITPRIIAVGLAMWLSAAAPAGPQDRVDTDRLMAALDRLPEKRAAWGGGEYLRGLEETADLIERELIGLGYEVQEQAFVWSRVRGDDPQTFRNLWVDLPGSTLPDEVLILGAHYDTVPGSPGADDNATGTAAALELARVLKNVRMERTVRIMFYSAEEAGLVGSRRYVEQIATPAVAAGEEIIHGMVSLEMLGYFSDEPGSQAAPAGLPAFVEIPDRGDFIAVVGLLPHIGFHLPFARAMMEAEPNLRVASTGLIPAATRDMYRSDHGSFWLAGIPAVMLTDTANFRNPHYHQPTDTIETIDRERFAMVVRAVAHATHQLCGPLPERPVQP